MNPSLILGIALLLAGVAIGLAWREIWGDLRRLSAPAMLYRVTAIVFALWYVAAIATVLDLLPTLAFGAYTVAVILYPFVVAPRLFRAFGASSREKRPSDIGRR